MSEAHSRRKARQLEEKTYRILAVNPGSTSTKYAYFENEDEKFSRTISHDADELSKFPTVQDQLDYRKELVERDVQAQGVDLDEIDVFVGRGGGMVPSLGGTYRINDKLVSDCEIAACGVHHPAQLASQICAKLIAEHGGQGFTVSPPDTDEYQDLARVTGLKDIFRNSRCHALNQKEVANRWCKAHGKRYADANLVVCHLGGGISITAHRRGLMVDGTDVLTGEGPMTPTRCGAMPIVKVLNLAYDGGCGKDEIVERLTKNGGLLDHLGTDDAREVEGMIEGGDEYAKVVYDAMIYQIGKFVGQMAVVLEGDVDAILLTGGMAHSDYLTSRIEKACGWIAPVEVYAGEFELEALAAGAMRVLRGEEEPRVYEGVPTFSGFDHLKRG